MAIVKFFKLDEVPVTWVSDAIYYIKTGNTVTSYVTDISGNPFEVTVDSLIALIESVDTNLALEVQDRVNADNALQDQIDLLSANFVFNETPIGVVNNVNQEFITSEIFVDNTTMVYYNGQRQSIGVGNDYIEIDNNTIQFTIPPKKGVVTLDYLKL